MLGHKLGQSVHSENVSNAFCPHYALEIWYSALFLWLGVPSTLIRHENRAFRKRSSNPRNLKTLACRRGVNRKHIEIQEGAKLNLSPTSLLPSREEGRGGKLNLSPTSLLPSREEGRGGKLNLSPTSPPEKRGEGASWLYLPPSRFRLFMYSI